MRRIEFVYFDAGGGHRSAATALKSVIDSQNRGWDVQLFNFQEHLDALDFVRSLTRVRMQDVYNLMLRRGWTLGSTQLMRVLQATIKLYHPLLVRRMTKYWRTVRPDMVVSFIPHFNRVLGESFRQAFPGRPFVTLLTDLADFPPHFWIEKQDQFFICGTERAVEQAREVGHSAHRIFRASGMILNPRFYTPARLDPAEERRRLGLDPGLRTGLVLFGGYGTRAMLEIAERVEGSELPVQLIFICGKNERLAERLRGRPLRRPRFVEGFTREVPHYMQLSDFFMGKPGPGSISEALAMQLPVIVERNARTLPQERYNAQWVRENNFGLTVKSWKEAVAATREVIEPQQFAARRERIGALKNRAVCEIPKALQIIMERGSL